MKKAILLLATLALMPLSSVAGTAVVDVDNTPVRVDVEVGRRGDNGRVVNRRWVCYAENRRGQLFRAVGRNQGQVQRRAMNQCFNYSRQCRPLGCDRIR